MEATSLRFAAAVRDLGRAARRTGLAVPAFRSPPRLPDTERTVRRRADGSVTIAIRLRGRPWPAVQADMIEGVIVANELRGRAAERARDALWAAVEGERSEAA
ncbi:MAG: hypothetical protein MUF83_15285 [Acidimicrobiales bacterium]|jgi:hypothetical protein|nr:hypothetical protein [Acidimicrobiales bacterium]